MASVELKTWYHLTDNAHFSLDPDFHPANNTTMGGDWPNAGLFVAPDPESWYNGHDYVRPFVVELEAPADDMGGYAREHFLPAERFGEARIKRIIPYEAYAAERWEDTPYEGPDVRDMSLAEITEIFEQTNAYIRDTRPHMLSFPCSSCGSHEQWNECMACGSIEEPDRDEFMRRGYLPQFRGTGDFYDIPSFVGKPDLSADDAAPTLSVAEQRGVGDDLSV